MDCQQGGLPVQRGGQEQGENLRDVAHQQELDDLLNVAVDPPPLLDGVGDGGEAVVQQDHVGGVLGHVGSGDPHGHADVRGLQGGGIVDPVPGHGGDLSGPLQGLNDPQLIRGRDPGEDRGGPHRGVQVLLGHGIQFVAGEDGVARPVNAQLPGDGQGGDLVVPCDHNGPNAGLLTGGHGAGHFLAGRIYHTGDAHKGQIAFHGVVLLPGDVLQGPHGKTQHPQGLL